VADESTAPGVASQQTADQLALALEEVGFDVGRAFPGLRIGWDGAGAPGVHLGSVTCDVAINLAVFLASAVDAGMTLPSR
jgi:hypothetical protein